MFLLMVYPGEKDATLNNQKHYSPVYTFLTEISGCLNATDQIYVTSDMGNALSYFQCYFIEYTLHIINENEFPELKSIGGQKIHLLLSKETYSSNQYILQDSELLISCDRYVFILFNQE